MDLLNIFLVLIIQISLLFPNYHCERYKLSIRLEELSNGTKIIECSVKDRTARLHLNCPLTSRSDKVCYSDCVSVCLKEEQCNEPISYCTQYYDKTNSKKVYKYYIEPTKLPLSGKWWCLYKNTQSDQYSINKSIPPPTTSTISSISTKITTTQYNNVPHKSKETEIVSKQPTKTDSSIRVISTVSPPLIHSKITPYSTPDNNYIFPSYIWHYLSRPELLLITIIVLGVSLVLNLCFLIRCVLLKSVIDNHYRGVPTSRCTLSCLCLDDARWWSLSHTGHGPGPGSLGLIGDVTTRSNSGAALALLSSTPIPGGSEHHTTTTLLGGPRGGYYHDKRFSMAPLLLGSATPTDNSASLPHFYRCAPQGQIPSHPGDSFQIYDDLSAISNGSNAVHPQPQHGYYHHKISSHSTNPNHPSSEVILLDNSSTLTNHIQDPDTTSQTGSNSNQTVTTMPNGNLSRIPPTSGSQSGQNPPNSYYHPSLGNYVIVSGPVVTNSDQYTIATHNNYIPHYHHHGNGNIPNYVHQQPTAMVSPIPSAPGSLIGVSNSNASQSNPNINPSQSSPQIRTTTHSNSFSNNMMPSNHSNGSNTSVHNNNSNSNIVMDTNNPQHKSQDSVIQESNENFNLLTNQESPNVDHASRYPHPHQYLPATPDTTQQQQQQQSAPQYASITPHTRQNNSNTELQQDNAGFVLDPTPPLPPQQQQQPSYNTDTLPPPPPQLN